jgi:hypothetical protein
MDAFAAHQYASVPPPLWFGSIDAAMAGAREGHCPLVVFFVAEWCQWSARLFSETLIDASARSVLQYVACARIEGDRSLPLVEQWDIDIYPTALVLAPDGRELGRIRGFDEPPAWARKLHEILMRGVPRTERR